MITLLRSPATAKFVPGGSKRPTASGRRHQAGKPTRMVIRLGESQAIVTPGCIELTQGNDSLPYGWDLTQGEFNRDSRYFDASAGGGDRRCRAGGGRVREHADSE